LDKKKRGETVTSFCRIINSTVFRIADNFKKMEEIIEEMKRIVMQIVEQGR